MNIKSELLELPDGGEIISHTVLIDASVEYEAAKQMVEKLITEPTPENYLSYLSWKFENCFSIEELEDFLVDDFDGIEQDFIGLEPNQILEELQPMVLNFATSIPWEFWFENKDKIVNSIYQRILES